MYMKRKSKKKGNRYILKIHKTFKIFKRNQRKPVNKLIIKENVPLSKNQVVHLNKLGRADQKSILIRY